VGRALWRRPAVETARVLVLARLDDAAAALRRLGDASDSEALHDFRVAVRRLRSILRAYRPYLKGSGAKRIRRDLGDLARATGAARDAEVHLAWLAEQDGQLTPRQRPGARWLRRRFETRREEATVAALARVRRDFERVARRARRRVPDLAVRVRVGESRRAVSWQAATGGLLREHARELQEALALVDSADRHAEAHGARIRGKRLRYLLEPLREGEERTGELLQRLKELQDLLGEWNDRHAVQQEIAIALQELAAERARALFESTLAADPDGRGIRVATRRDERPGLLALATLARRRQEELFRELSASWKGDAKGFFAELEAVASGLDARRANVSEIERKYLLRALPVGVEQAPADEIEQGYLPGRRWQERLRRVRAGNGERFYRTVKLGVGLERTEVEEETDAETFERLWSLTEGRRVRKRRYRVEDDGRIWEIDEFLDRDLVLAEVELESAAETPAPPDWLRPVLLRDVTGAPEYQNARLAR
jgi:CHAD domain-containing protein/CYTH domain-containing protein